MIYTYDGCAVYLVGAGAPDPADPTTVEDPRVIVQSRDNPDWVREMRISLLKADDGRDEIDAAMSMLV